MLVLSRRLHQSILFPTLGPLTEPGRVDGWFRKPLNLAQLAQAMNAAAGNN